MGEQTDAELVADVLAGQRDAFASLVRKYQDYAYGTAIGILSNFELARDVVQEAFLSAYRDLRRLREPDRFAGWLHGIARNTALNALRELRRVQELARQMSHEAEPPDPAPTPDRSAEEAERREIVMGALGNLGEKNREAVSLYYVDGLSYADIAGFLDVTEATVQGRLQRGREELRKELRMVKDTFDKEKLPEDFSAEVQRLLGAAAEHGRRGDAAVNRLAHDAMERLTAIGAPAVDPLCEALGDPSIFVRRAAARALCRIGDARALRPILRLLYARDAWRYVKVLGDSRILRIPGMRAEMLRLLDEDDGDERGWAINVLAHAVGDDEVYDRLLALFRDATMPTGLRCQALSALCRLKEGVVGELVCEALAAPPIRRRSGWAWWIALSQGHALPIDLCVPGFAREVAPISRWMAGQLILRHGDEGRAVLDDLLRTGTPDQRAAAAVTLAREHGADVFEALMAELIDGYQHRKWQRIVAREAMHHYADDLIAWVGAEGVPRDRPALAWVAAKLRIAAGRGSADDILHYGTPASRMAAVQTLASERGAAFIPELRRCLLEGRPRKVAQEAFWQMHRLGDDALPAALEMLASEHWTERKAAVCLLRRWGKLSKEQRLAAASDSHISVRHAAEWHPVYVEAAESGHRTWRRNLRNDTPPDPPPAGSE